MDKGVIRKEIEAVWEGRKTDWQLGGETTEHEVDTLEAFIEAYDRMKQSRDDYKKKWLKCSRDKRKIHGSLGSYK